MWIKSLTFVLVSCIHFGSTSVQDGGRAPRLLLNDGNSIPAMGLGTFLGFDEKGQKEIRANEVSEAVQSALAAGYRLLDTAALYLNEDQVGRGVRDSGVDREKVFVVDKLPTNDERNVVQGLRDSLKKLNMTYVDLYLIHFPIAFKKDHKTYDVVDYVDTWKAMEEAKSLGLAKSIGISNFNISQMERLMENCKVKPAVLQVEVNLNLRQDKILEFCKQHGIVVMGYTPFGTLFDKSEGLPPPRVNDVALIKIAEKYNKTTPQIVLRFLIQRGVVPIPKSVHKNRIEQNLDVFDFILSEEDMETLYKFGDNYHRVVWPTYWQDHPYFPFEKTDKVGKNPFEGKPL